MPLEQREGPDDAQLVARSLKQDHEAFGQLIDRHATVIVNLAYRMVGNRAEAEDLAQETFLSAFKALSTFRADSKFSTWLYRIASNKCKDWLRVKHPGQAQQDVDVEEMLRPILERNPNITAAQMDQAITVYKKVLVPMSIAGALFSSAAVLLLLGLWAALLSVPLLLNWAWESLSKKWQKP